ncbi:hypothetical protein HYH03_011696 [Edaphochlamys debaryana]|uniref:Protein kinase domain-containing protein n=1 Tax=Edaphochlamys debaryana TaxID=47281 RepID=A0A836BW99_9CHLO|nr:hypothetical protein HYH03_011696 [Edaphochlamys debaryana]|eukprot:KAG2489894.1 hypothetical protein HYH03_011696 [Edaphochlamys debaryana]
MFGLANATLASTVFLELASRRVRLRVTVSPGGFVGDCSDASLAAYKARLGSVLGLSAVDVRVLCVVQPGVASGAPPPRPPTCSALTAALVLDTTLRLPPSANETAVQARMAALPGSDAGLAGLCVPAPAHMPPTSATLDVVLSMPDPTALYAAAAAAADPAADNADNASALLPRVAEALSADVALAVALGMGVALEQVSIVPGSLQMRLSPSPPPSPPAVPSPPPAAASPGAAGAPGPTVGQFDDPSDWRTPVIIGLSVGAAVVAAILLFALWRSRRRRDQRDPEFSQLASHRGKSNRSVRFDDDEDVNLCSMTPNAGAAGAGAVAGALGASSFKRSFRHLSSSGAAAAGAAGGAAGRESEAERSSGNGGAGLEPLRPKHSSGSGESTEAAFAAAVAAANANHAAAAAAAAASGGGPAARRPPPTAPAVPAFGGQGARSSLDLMRQAALRRLIEENRAAAAAASGSGFGAGSTPHSSDLTGGRDGASGRAPGGSGGSSFTRHSEGDALAGGGRSTGPNSAAGMGGAVRPSSGAMMQMAGAGSPPMPGRQLMKAEDGVAAQPRMRSSAGGGLLARVFSRKSRAGVLGHESPPVAGSPSPSQSGRYRHTATGIEPGGASPTHSATGGIGRFRQPSAIGAAPSVDSPGGRLGGFQRQSSLAASVGGRSMGGRSVGGAGAGNDSAFATANDLYDTDLDRGTDLPVRDVLMAPDGAVVAADPGSPTAAGAAAAAGRDNDPLSRVRSSQAISRASSRQLDTYKSVLTDEETGQEVVVYDRPRPPRSARLAGESAAPSAAASSAASPMHSPASSFRGRTRVQPNDILVVPSGPPSTSSLLSPTTPQTPPPVSPHLQPPHPALGPDHGPCSSAPDRPASAARPLFSAPRPSVFDGSQVLSADSGKNEGRGAFYGPGTARRGAGPMPASLDLGDGDGDDVVVVEESAPRGYGNLLASARVSGAGARWGPTASQLAMQPDDDGGFGSGAQGYGGAGPDLDSRPSSRGGSFVGGGAAALALRPPSGRSVGRRTSQVLFVDDDRPSSAGRGRTSSVKGGWQRPTTEGLDGSRGGSPQPRGRPAASLLSPPPSAGGERNASVVGGLGPAEAGAGGMAGSPPPAAQLSPGLRGSGANGGSAAPIIASSAGPTASGGAWQPRRAASVSSRFALGARPPSASHGNAYDATAAVAAARATAPHNRVGSSTSDETEPSPGSGGAPGESAWGGGPAAAAAAGSSGVDGAAPKDPSLRGQLSSAGSAEIDAALAGIAAAGSAAAMAAGSFAAGGPPRSPGVGSVRASTSGAAASANGGPGVLKGGSRAGGVRAGPSRVRFGWGAGGYEAGTDEAPAGGDDLVAASAASAAALVSQPQSRAQAQTSNDGTSGPAAASVVDATPPARGSRWATLKSAASASSAGGDTAGREEGPGSDGAARQAWGSSASAPPSRTSTCSNVLLVESGDGRFTVVASGGAAAHTVSAGTQLYALDAWDDTAELDTPVILPLVPRSSELSLMTHAGRPLRTVGSLPPCWSQVLDCIQGAVPGSELGAAVLVPLVFGARRIGAMLLVLPPGGQGQAPLSLSGPGALEALGACVAECCLGPVLPAVEQVAAAASSVASAASLSELATALTSSLSSALSAELHVDLTVRLAVLPYKEASAGVLFSNAADAGATSRTGMLQTQATAASAAAPCASPRLLGGASRHGPGLLSQTRHVQSSRVLATSPSSPSPLPSPSNCVSHSPFLAIPRGAVAPPGAPASSAAPAAEDPVEATFTPNTPFSRLSNLIGSVASDSNLAHIHHGASGTTAIASTMLEPSVAPGGRQHGAALRNILSGSMTAQRVAWKACPFTSSSTLLAALLAGKAGAEVPDVPAFLHDFERPSKDVFAIVRRSGVGGGLASLVAISAAWAASLSESGSASPGSAEVARLPALGVYIYSALPLPPSLLLVARNQAAGLLKVLAPGVARALTRGPVADQWSVLAGQALGGLLGAAVQPSPSSKVIGTAASSGGCGEGAGVFGGGLDAGAIHAFVVDAAADPFHRVPVAPAVSSPRVHPLPQDTPPPCVPQPLPRQGSSKPSFFRLSEVTAGDALAGGSGSGSGSGVGGAARGGSGGGAETAVSNGTNALLPMVFMDGRQVVSSMTCLEDASGGSAHIAGGGSAHIAGGRTAVGGPSQLSRTVPHTAKSLIIGRSATNPPVVTNTSASLSGTMPTRGRLRSLFTSAATRRSTDIQTATTMCDAARATVTDEIVQFSVDVDLEAETRDMLEETMLGVVTQQQQLATLVTAFTTTLARTRTDTADLNGSVHAEDDIRALTISRPLGQGACSVVMLGSLHAMPVAVKVILPLENEQEGDADPGDGGAAAEGPLAAGRSHSKLMDVAHSLESAGPPGAVSVGGGPGAVTNGTMAKALQARASATRGTTLRRRKRLQALLRSARELAVLTSISHPNIVQVYSYCTRVTVEEPEPTRPRLRVIPEDAEVQEGSLCSALIMEFCDMGSLADAIDSGMFAKATRRAMGRAPSGGGPGGRQQQQQQAAAVAAAGGPAMRAVYLTLLEVALALRHLHTMSLVHCDVKPANVLLRSSATDPRGFTAKLTDFGFVSLASSLADGGGAEGGPQQEPVGTVTHMAPELFIKRANADSSIDCYAFGILMWETYTGRAPYAAYAETGFAEVPYKVTKEGLRPRFPPDTPPLFRQLAQESWSAAPSQRPSAASLVVRLQALLDASCGSA